MAEGGIRVQALPEHKTIHVFIVHSREDINWAKRIKAEFAECEISCMIKDENLVIPSQIKLLGDDQFQILQYLENIKRSCVVILLFSKTFLVDTVCEFERNFCLYLLARYGKQFYNVISLRLDNTVIPPEYEAAGQSMDVDEDIVNWWHKLLKTVTEDVENQRGTDVSEESQYKEEIYYPDKGKMTKIFQFLDEIFGETHSESSEGDSIIDLSNRLAYELRNSSLQRKARFVEYSKEIGLSHFIGQTGFQNVHRLLMNGCGMEIRRNTLFLNWDTFEPNLLRSNLTLSDIVSYGKMSGISKILFSFNEETQKRIEEKYGQDWQYKFIKFAEKILSERFTEGCYDQMTYRVRIKGDASLAVKTKINNSAKSLYLTDYKMHVEKYSTLDARLATYWDWPVSLSALRVEHFAKAGFIYTGSADTVVCFCCNQTLYGKTKLLEIADRDHFWMVPWVSHVYWSPDCKYVEDNKWIFKEIQNSLEEIKNLGLTEHQGRHYSTIASRFNSYKTVIPESVRQNFAEAGFYDDCGHFGDTYELGVVCFSCGTSIFDVDLTKDPWIEHLRWSPNCKYVEEIKGKGFVEDVNKMLHGLSLGGRQTELMIETIMMKERHTAEKDSG